MIQKRWFHATTKENWEKIKKDGLRRGTFLARNLEELVRMINLPLIGDLEKCELVLSVKHIPSNLDEYNPKSWEMVVRKSIVAENIRFLRYL